jgi:hypothetical protein
MATRNKTAKPAKTSIKDGDRCKVIAGTLAKNVQVV